MTPHPGTCAYTPAAKKLSASDIRPSERGSVSVIAAAGAVVCVTMLVTVMVSGFYIEHLLRLSNYADSWAMASGLEVLLSPRDAWLNGTRGFSERTLATGHGFGQIPTLSATRIDPYARRSEDYAANDGENGYAPVFTQAFFESEFSVPGINELYKTFLGGSNLPRVHDSGMARINQVSLASSELYRERVVLMLDVSRTMRLDYLKNGASSGISAFDGEKLLANEMVKSLGRFYDLGLLAFSDGVAPPVKTPLSGQTGDLNDDPLVKENEARDAMLNTIGTMGTSGDGTNIQEAIRMAKGMINETQMMAELPYQAPTLIIVSDGEPNISDSVRANTGSLSQAQAQAAADTKNYMQELWRPTSLDKPDNIDSVVIQIQREQSVEGLHDADTDFMKGLAGHGAKNGAGFGADPNNYHADTGDPTSSLTFIARRPKFPICVMTSFENIAALRNRNWLMPRPKKDVITAFLGFTGAAVAANSHEVQVPQENIFVDDEPGFTAWRQRYENGARLDDTGVNLEKGLSGLAENPTLLALSYDSVNKRILVSNYLCAALHSVDNKNQSVLRVRMRWAAPHLLDAKKADVNMY